MTAMQCMMCHCTEPCRQLVSGQRPAQSHDRAAAAADRGDRARAARPTQTERQCGLLHSLMRTNCHRTALLHHVPKTSCGVESVSVACLNCVCQMRHSAWNAVHEVCPPSCRTGPGPLHPHVRPAHKQRLLGCQHWRSGLKPPWTGLQSAPQPQLGYVCVLLQCSPCCA